MHSGILTHKPGQAHEFDWMHKPGSVDVNLRPAQSRKGRFA